MELNNVYDFVFAVWPVWLFGLVVGLMCPRSPQLMTALRIVVDAIAGARVTFLGRLMMLVNGAMFIQQVWYRYTSPGTFRGLCCALYNWLLGRGWKSDFNDGAQRDTFVQRETSDHAKDNNSSQWYVTDDDLDFFRARVERQEDVGAGPWDTIVDQVLEGELVYRAQRRMLPIRKTEYKSTSVTANTTPREVMDFYLSDPVRQSWDNLLTTAETLQSGEFSKRELVVHWVRSFPFSFLSDRDYVIARREFEDNGVLYGISKVIPYPSHDPGRLVQMDNYWSMWSCRSVPCPFNSGKPATETILLHMEDFKIPENLSRFAVKHGMWGFVKKMTPYMQSFVQQRRMRCAPDSPDPLAFGANLSGNAKATREVRSENGELLRQGSTTSLGNQRPSKLRKVASAVVAGSMLLALGGIGTKAMDDHADRKNADKARSKTRAGFRRAKTGL